MQTKEDIRFRDFRPKVPLVDDPNVLTLYAEDVANITVHGENFTTTYCEWTHTSGGLIVRVPVVKIVRPLRSLFGLRESVAEMLDGQSVMAH